MERALMFVVLSCVTCVPTVFASPATKFQEPEKRVFEPVREIRVKIVYDQFFAENAKKLMVNDSIEITPNDVAITILMRLSQRYENNENNFGIKLVPVHPMTFITLILPATNLTDLGYVNVLIQEPCDGADIMIELTGLHLAPSKNGEHFAPLANEDASGADETHNRIFSGLYADKTAHEEIAAIVTRLDHELRHLFGADHPDGVRQGTEEADRFMRESAAVVLANRDKPLTCTDQAAN